MYYNTPPYLHMQMQIKQEQIQQDVRRWANPNHKSIAGHKLYRTLIIALILIVTILFIKTPSISAQERLPSELAKTFGQRFGEDGTIPISGGEPHSVATQPDGKIVVVGTKDAKFWIARFHEDGTPDVDFGTNGQTTIGFGKRAVARAAAFHPEKETIIAVGLAGKDFALTSVLNNGEVDSQFGTVTTDFDGDNDLASDVLIQPDSQIVVGGTITDCGLINCLDQEFGVARYLANGQLDKSFDGDGKVVAGFGGFKESLTNLALQQDGKIVLIGLHEDTFSNNHDVAVARLHPDGRFDNTLDGDGKATTGFVGFGQSGVLQTDNRIIVASDEGKMMRFQTNGNRNSTFGAAGRTLLDVGDGERLTESVHLVRLKNDTIVAIGSTEPDANTGNNTIYVAGYNGQDGQPDPGFGSIPRNFVIISDGQNQVVTDAVVDQRDRIVLLVEEAGSHRLIRVNGAGVIEDGGYVVFDPTSNDDHIKDMLIQPDGKIVVAGNHGSAGGNADESIITRFNPDGTLDDTFGESGIFQSPIQGSPQKMTALAQEASGRILAASSFRFSDIENRIAVHAILPDGTADPTFGDLSSTPGTLVFPLTGFNDPLAIKVQPDGKFVVVGVNNDDALAIRFDANGLIDKTFNGTGFLLSDNGGSSERFFDVAIQPDGKLVLVGWGGSNGPSIMIERRLSNGALDLEFGLGGRAFIGNRTGFEGANKVVLRGDTITVSAFEAGEEASAVLIRLDANGTPISTFGEGSSNGEIGVTRAQFRDKFGEQPINNKSMTIRSNGDILTVGCTSTLPRRFVLMLFDVNGKIKREFQQPLQFGTNFTAHQDCPAALAIDPITQNIVVAGTIDTPGRGAYVIARYQFKVPLTALADEFTTNQPETLVVDAPGVLGNDISQDGSPVAVLEDAPKNGTFTLNADGSFSYQPDAGFSGIDGFTYRATAGNNGPTAPVLVTISVTDSNTQSRFLPLTRWVDEYGDSGHGGWGSNNHHWSTIQFPDVNGDGRADVCGRSTHGIFCALAKEDGTSFEAPSHWDSGIDFANEAGWHEHPSYYSTIRFPDLNNDGMADVCGRFVDGMQCAFSDGTQFLPATQWTTEYHDNGGWDKRPSYWATLRYPDINGDGRADVCARSSVGIFCAMAQENVSGFTEPTHWENTFSNANGWSSNRHPESWATIRYPDINGDGKADVCGRHNDGIICGTSTGEEFTEATMRSPFFSNVNGWHTDPSHWGTIRFPDVNGDGKADVCGRAQTGVYCALAGEDLFAPAALWSDHYRDTIGWGSDASFWQTIQYADLNNDGKDDICGRFLNGMQCALSTGTEFETVSTWQNEFSDGQGWDADQSHYLKVLLADVNGDGKVDICGRHAEGMFCTSNQTSAETPAEEPSDNLSVFYMSASTSGEINGISYRDEDLLAFDTTDQTWTFLIDGSDIGLGATDINAFHWQTKDSLLMSINRPIDLPGLGRVDDADILRFVPESLGANTTGRLELFLRGRDIGLESGPDDIDAIALTTDGRLVISLLAGSTVPGNNGVLAVSDEDLLVRDGDAWEILLDGSAIGLAQGDEDIHALWIDGDGFQLSTRGDFNMDGLSGDGVDLFRCQVSNATQVEGGCIPTLDGSTHGLDSQSIDAFSIGQAGVKGSSLSDDSLTIPDDFEMSDDDDDIEEDNHIFLPFVRK